MPFRVWVGFWTGLFIFLIVAFDLSALVRYITRFTEESFACLIALIFIYEAFKKTFEIEHDSPVHFHPPEEATGCYCILSDGSKVANFTSTTIYTTTVDFGTTGSNVTGTNVTQAPSVNDQLSSFARTCMLRGGTVEGECGSYVADVFFFSLLLFFGTFLLATSLVNFRHSLFLPTFVSTLNSST